MATITDDDLKMFQERARNELTGRGTGSIAWDSVIWDLCHEVRKLRSASKERGDAAKLREAIEKIHTIAKTFIDATKMRRVTDSARLDVGNIKDLADAALAAPATTAPMRNCDRFKTAAEAIDAYQDLTGDQLATDSGMKEWVEFAVWLFASATEKEGGNDGNE